MSNEQDPSKQGQAEGATGGAAQGAGTAPQYLTRETFGEALKELLPGLINPAITGHIRRLESKVEERFKALTPAQQKAVEADVGEGAEAGAVDGGAQAAATTKTQPAAPSAEAARIASLEKQLAKLARDAEKAQAEAARERRQRIEDAGYETVRATLRGKVVAGAEDDLLDAWRARKQVVIGDDGITRLRLSTPDEPEEGLDVPAAVAAFLKTEKAKLYLPPPNGAGARAGARPSTNGQGVTARGATTPATAFEQKFGKPWIDALKGG